MSQKSSSGDRKGERTPYLRAWFWLDPINHFWESDWYSEDSKEYYRKNIVEVAQREMDKSGKEDLIISLPK